MNELSAFERRLAAGLDAVAGPRRSIDAIAIARTAASRARVRRSVLSRFSATAGQAASVRDRRLQDLAEGRSARPLVVLIAVALITVLAFGALAVGSVLVRLPSVVQPLPVPTSSAGPSSPQPSGTSVSIPPTQRAATWTATGPMAMDREDQTATLLLDGTVLVAGGGKDETSAELYDPKVGTWMATGSMTHRRMYETATLLADGRVLVAGGGSASAELYDPSSGTWTATGSMLTSRTGHTATLLMNGKVLVAGGDKKDAPVPMASSSELYDPSTGRWTASGSMTTACDFHTATSLSDGNVLVTSLGSAELYDPNSGTWIPTGAMVEVRASPSATLLSDGKVLVAGGARAASAGSPMPSAELYDPSTRTWTSTGAMIQARYTHRATLLPDGTVLVAGGYGYKNDSGYLASAELYDPRTGTWSATAAMIEARVFHTLTRLSDGRVLAVGGGRPLGIDLASAELYDTGTSR